MTTLELLCIDHGRMVCGCTACRTVWHAAVTADVVCPECAATGDIGEMWTAFKKPAPPLPPAESRQYQRTAMTVALILIVTLWAIPLCVVLAHGQTIRACVPDYDDVASLIVINSRLRPPPADPTPTPGMLTQLIAMPPTRTPLPTGVCTDMDPATTGYVEVPVTTITRRAVFNGWTAWSISADGIASAASNTIQPTPIRQRPGRLVP